mmetsp:Transcript_3337/g.5941  ORF Transcript_3337/g.5941 Transcript_3337/m.5941 type:complete len:214 (+) Transcript_3337:50-691(+)|eukprot:CAMPEP_0202699630 /NCGR_PEP_ID=MMETSP1385-20130828/12855_1 /ASSEMBLY_ACC=CAM_ASM_000861 /TAXON_ID=933848 /ORGANISM="Elphidium margaritaceum" /LENGTH=213 /DNA_ID=CAMNT_0049356611 /DNA_START=45 /DNA_END=686 /DNA_ORIENTATION=-
MGCMLGCKCCGICCCFDDADERISKPSTLSETTPLGKTGKTGEATKDSYVEQFQLSPAKCIQGQATTDDELCEFLQKNINVQELECLVVISSKPAHAYRLPKEEATETGINILGQLILANAATLRVFHLNGQNLDWKRSQNISNALSKCEALEVVDLYDCLLDNDNCLFLFDALKQIPSLKTIQFGKNDINADARNSVQEEQQEKYPNLEIIF